MVVTLSPFKANLAISDVLLPIAPFTETPGTFVNAEGRVQGFHAVVKPLGETRPAWKVLRVLGNMLGLPGFEYETAAEVLADARGAGDAGQPLVQGSLNNATRRRAKAGLAGRCSHRCCRHPVVGHLPARLHRAPCAVAAAHRRRAAAGLAAKQGEEAKEVAA